MIEIVPVPVLSDNYVWLMHEPGSGETVAVDPSVADPVLAAAAARGWSSTQIWNTHCSLMPCFGMAWEVTSGLAPGQSIMLSSLSPS